MSTYHPAMQKASLADIESDVHGLISKRTAELNGVSVTQVTFDKGARWSEDLKEYAGTDLCELPHVAVVTSGALGVQMTDGSEEVFSAGDVMLLPPGHDAWTVGDEACTFLTSSPRLKSGDSNQLYGLEQ
jgi:quercetin dioxygenase-like cupin family protein